MPELMASLPTVGSTLDSESILRGAGSAPALRSEARALASSSVKLPVICPLRPISLSMTGEETSSSSRMIASLRPMWVEVSSENLAAA